MTTVRAFVVSNLLLACTIAAQNPATSALTFKRHPFAEGGATDAAAHREEEKAVAGTFGVDFTTAYYFRGILQENQGLIAQPHAELDYTLFKGGELLRSVDLTFGTWNSVHSGPSGASGGRTAWYESDFYWGLGFGIDEKWSASASYIYYVSPNGAFSTAEELVLGASYDDASLWGEGFSGLQPAATLGIEVKGQADGGTDRGIYGQLAIEPSFSLGKTGDFDWTLAAPVAMGFSLRDYYQNAAGTNHAFGFFDVGAALSSPLAIVPSRFGPWTMTASLHALMLGDTTKQINGGDGFELIASLGVSTTF